MIHIRQKNSVGTNTYGVVITDGYGGENQPPIEQHPSILEHPELFEIVDTDIPEHYQNLIYTSDINP